MLFLRGGYRPICLVSLLLFFLSVLIFLDKYGKSFRHDSGGYVVGDPRLISVTVDMPKDAYTLWREKGYRGRIVMSVGSRLYFLPSWQEYMPTDKSLPLHYYSFSRDVETRLGDNNILVTALITGIARSVQHIIPHSVFAEKAAATKGEKGATVTEHAIVAPYFGSPRVITTPAFLLSPGEPVLLYINASIFRETTPRELFSQLVSSGITTDSIILCRSYDDNEVTDKERGELSIFAGLLSAPSHGK